MIGRVIGNQWGYYVELYDHGVEIDTAGPFDDAWDAEDAAHRCVGDDGVVNVDLRFNRYAVEAV